MKYIIFLDVDGVLNTIGTQDTYENFVGIEDKYVQNLSTLVKRFDEPVSIVLTTTWATEWYRDIRDKELQDGAANYLDNKLRKQGLHAIDKIWDCCTWDRGGQVKRYVQQHPEVIGYLILDDVDLNYTKAGVKPHWIQTYEDKNGGFKVGLIDWAERILRNEVNGLDAKHSDVC